MARIRILVWDSQEEYAKRLLRYLEEYPGIWQGMLAPVDTKEEVAALIGQWKIDVLLYSEDRELPEQWIPPDCAEFVLVEQKRKEDTSDKRIWRYQSVEDILNRIQKEYRKKYPWVADNRQEGTQIIGIAGLGDGSLGEKWSRVIAEMSVKRGIRVLHLSLNPFLAVEEYWQGNVRGNWSRLLYEFLAKGKDAFTSVRDAISVAENEVYYVASPEKVTDFRGIAFATLEPLLIALKESKLFDYIFLSFSLIAFWQDEVLWKLLDRWCFVVRDEKEEAVQCARFQNLYKEREERKEEGIVSQDILVIQEDETLRHFTKSRMVFPIQPLHSHCVEELMEHLREQWNIL